MANSFTNIIPTIMAEGLEVLRESCATLSAVNTGYSAEAREIGDTITIPVPVAQSVAAVSPSNTPPANTDVTPTTVTVALDQWNKTDFHLTNKEELEIAAGGFVNTQAGEAVRALANEIDADLLGQATVDSGVYNHVGTAGTTPFASESAFQSAWQKGARKLLRQGLARFGPDIYCVIDEDAEGNLGSLAQFTDADRRGDDRGMLEGEIGRKMGATWLVNQNTRTFTGGTLTNGSGKLANVNGAVAAGATTMAVDESSLSGTLVDGDVFTVASVSGYFLVTNGTLTASGNAIAAVNFTPAAPTGGFADNAVVTFAGDHVVNMAFHSNAFALAFSPIQDSGLAGGSGITETITAPVSGVTLRLKITEEYYQTTWRWDVLNGVKCVRPELACRILG